MLGVEDCTHSRCLAAYLVRVAFAKRQTALQQAGQRFTVLYTQCNWPGRVGISPASIL